VDIGPKVSRTHPRRMLGIYTHSILAVLAVSDTRRLSAGLIKLYKKLLKSIIKAYNIKV
jgi:hypothetical protein